MRIGCYIACVAAVLVSGCADDRQEDRALRVHALMSEEMEPAADGIWDAAGYIITAAGEEELWPTSDEGWQAVSDSANALIALSAKMKTPDYTHEGEWDEIADGLVVAAERVKRAVEGREKEELFEAGGHVYRVCVSCHERYMIDEAGK